MWYYKAGDPHTRYYYSRTLNCFLRVHDQTLEKARTECLFDYLTMIIILSVAADFHKWPLRLTSHCRTKIVSRCNLCGIRLDVKDWELVAGRLGWREWPCCSSLLTELLDNGLREAAPSVTISYTHRAAVSSSDRLAWVNDCQSTPPPPSLFLLLLFLLSLCLSGSATVSIKHLKGSIGRRLNRAPGCSREQHKSSAGSLRGSRAAQLIGGKIPSSSQRYGINDWGEHVQ